MSDNQRDIDGLLGYLSLCVENRHPLMPMCVAADYYAALTALLAERDAFAAELARANAERDEARRQACYLKVKYQDRCACPPSMSIAKYVTQDAIRLARLRGWDCFDAPHAKTTDVPVQDGGVA